MCLATGDSGTLSDSPLALLEFSAWQPQLWSMTMQRSDALRYDHKWNLLPLPSDLLASCYNQVFSSHITCGIEQASTPFSLKLSNYRHAVRIKWGSNCGLFNLTSWMASSYVLWGLPSGIPGNHFSAAQAREVLKGELSLSMAGAAEAQAASCSQAPCGGSCSSELSH